MKWNGSIITLLLGLILTTSVFGQTTKPTNYLGIAEPIVFDNVAYHLVWTSHPATNYYKQEYIRKGDTVETFKKLILLEALVGDMTIKDVLDAKIEELDKIKKSNPVVHYETFERDGEYILDFLISENTPDGKLVSIIERNVYRYKSVVNKEGKRCVLLFGVSERAYGNDITEFLQNLKSNRSDLINAVGAYAIPDIKL